MLLPQSSFNFKQTLEKACNPGKYRPLLFLVPVSGTLKRSYPSYLAIIHKAISVSSGKRSSRASRPLGLLFVYFSHQGHMPILCKQISHCSTLYSKMYIQQDMQQWLLPVILARTLMPNSKGTFKLHDLVFDLSMFSDKYHATF